MMTRQNPNYAELNKDVVRRFYKAALAIPGPDFATIKALTDEQEVELNWGIPQAVSTVAPTSGRRGTACISSPG